MAAVTDSDVPAEDEAASSEEDRTSGSTGPERSAEDLLAECLELSESEWARAIREACARRPDLATSLEQLFRNVHAIDAALRSSSDRAGHDDELPVPSTLGDFELVERVGGGGMGVVYRARQISLDRTVALKLIRPEHLYFEKSKIRFRREAEAISRLHHPGIVPLYEAGEENRLPYFAMEFIEGQSVATILNAIRFRDPAKLRAADFIRAYERGGGTAPTPSPEGIFSGVGKKSWAAQCCRLVARAAYALDHAHQNGVIHRDIKPSNLMVTASGRVVIVDFGLALSEGAASLTRTGSHPGSLPYMSPEQIAGDQVDSRSDIYSLGVTLYELLTLRCPFPLTNPELARRHIALGAFDRPRSRNRAISPEVEAVCLKAMDLDRERRYSSSSQFAEDLANAVTHRPILAHPLSLERRFVRLMRRHPARTLAVTALFLALVIGPLLFAWLQYSHATTLRREQSATQAALARASESEAEAKAISDFLRDVLVRSTPYTASRPDLTVRDALLGSLKTVDDRFARVPITQVRVLASLSAILTSHGMRTESATCAERALAIARQTYSPRDPRMIEPMILVAEHRRPIEAEGILREALDIAADSMDVIFESCNAWAKLSYLQYSSGRLEEAEASIRRAIVRAEYAATNAPGRRSMSEWRQLLADYYGQLAERLWIRGRTREARRVAIEALERSDKWFGANSPFALSLLWALANIDKTLDNPKQGVWADRAARIQRVAFEDHHPQSFRARIMTRLGSQSPGGANGEELSKLTHDAREAFGSQSDQYASILCVCSASLLAGDRFAEASKLASEVLELQRSLGQSMGPLSLTAFTQRALAECNLGNAVAAWGDATQALAIAGRGYAAEKRMSPVGILASCASGLRRGVLAETESLLRSVAASLWVGDECAESLHRRVDQVLATVVWRQGRLEEASQIHARIVREARTIVPPDRICLVAALKDAADMHYTHGDLGAAEAALQEAVEVEIALYGQGNFRVAMTRNQLAMMLLIGRPSEPEFARIDELLSGEVPTYCAEARRLERDYLRGLLAASRGDHVAGRAAMKDAIDRGIRGQIPVCTRLGHFEFGYALSSFAIGEAGEGEEWAGRGCNGLALDPVPAVWLLGRARVLLARCLIRAEDYDGAAANLRDLAPPPSGGKGWDLLREEFEAARGELLRRVPETRSLESSLEGAPK